MNMGNLSPLNQSKLKEVLNYLTTNNSDFRAKSTGKRHKETNSSFYGTKLMNNYSYLKFIKIVYIALEFQL